MKRSLQVTAIAAAICAPCTWAQTPPSTGQILRELAPAPATPTPSPSFQLQPPTPGSADTKPGGPKVEVRSVVIVGNSVLTEAQIRSVIGDVTGQSFDLAGLQAIASKVSDLYRRSGYPFARAFLPPQDMKDGTLRIEVLEGRYGEVKAIGAPDVVGKIQRYLAPLAQGKVIESTELERITLLIDDLPDIAITPIMRPGSVVGTGDLDIQIQKTAPQSGEVGFDNHGNYYSGELRTRGAINLNGAFTLGDTLSISGLYSEQNLWLASLNYSAPVGFDGWRANAGYSETSYSLAKGFEGNTGTAKVTSIGASYPIIRSQKYNLNFNLSVQEKRLYNSRSNGTDIENYSITNTPVGLQFDRRDALGAGGITYGSFMVTPGRLDNTSGKENFLRWNADVMRLQNLGGRWTAYGRLSTQNASKNLNSAEKFLLGGPTGVRGYPTGEASGDEGWLTQLEVRYAFDEATTPYAFYDHGRVKVNADIASVTSPAADKERAGYGAGVRHVRGRWSVDGALGWRSKGGAPESVTGKDPKPRIWLNASYRF